MIRLPPDRQTDRQTWDEGVGCSLTLQLIDRWGEAFVPDVQTGRGCFSHCAETTGLETIRADGNPGQAVSLRHSAIILNIYWEQFAPVMVTKPPVTKAQFIIPSTFLKIIELVNDTFVFTLTALQRRKALEEGYFHSCLLRYSLPHANLSPFVHSPLVIWKLFSFAAFSTNNCHQRTDLLLTFNVLLVQTSHRRWFSSLMPKSPTGFHWQSQNSSSVEKHLLHTSLIGAFVVWTFLFRISVFFSSCWRYCQYGKLKLRTGFMFKPHTKYFEVWTLCTEAISNAFAIVTQCYYYVWLHKQPQ